MLFVLSYLLRDKYPLLVLAFVLFIVGFLATSGLISFAFQKYSIVADRYMYFSFIGISLAISLALEMAGKKYLFIIFIVILLVFASLSAFRQIPIWKDTFSLWQHSRSLEAVPSYAESNLRAIMYNKGLEFARNGEIEKALINFDDIIQHYPKDQKYESKYVDLFYNRGVIMMKKLKIQDALNDFNAALKINSNNIGVYNARVKVYLELKQYKNAWANIDIIHSKGASVNSVFLQQLQQACPRSQCMIEK